MVTGKTEVDISTNDSAIKLTILKLAKSGKANQADCISHISNQILEHDSQMGIAPSLSPKRLGLDERIKNCCEQLFAANLLVSLNEHEFGLTQYGEEILNKNQNTFDEKSLIPRSKNHQNFRQVAGALAGALAAKIKSINPYDEGLAAFNAGIDYTENPYPNDRAEHLSWHNGWAEGLDHEKEHGPLYHTWPNA